MLSNDNLRLLDVFVVFSALFWVLHVAKTKSWPVLAKKCFTNWAGKIFAQLVRKEAFDMLIIQKISYLAIPNMNWW